MSTVKKSKQLSKVLRHAPESVGLTLDSAGWVQVSDLLKAVAMTMDELEEVVVENNKKRFEFSEGHERIRASQGHSVEVELEYTEKTPPAILYHGTSATLVDTILESGGLSRMKRHHVHLSADVETALIVAGRRPKPTVLGVRALAAHKDGHKFYLSTNGVWLTESVPKTFIYVLPTS